MEHYAILIYLSISRQGPHASSFQGKVLMPQFLKVHALVFKELFENKQNISASLSLLKVVKYFDLSV